MSDLKSEFDYYVKNQKDLVKKYKGKYLVIRGQKVVAVFSNELEAYADSSGKYEAGTFLIQPCLPGEDSISQTFYSRVSV